MVRQITGKYGITLGRVLLLLSVIASASLYFLFNNPTENVLDLSTGLDRMLPFVPSFIIFYDIWYPFIIIGGMILFFLDGNIFKRAALALDIGYLSSYVTFYFFQSTVTRPDVSGGGIFLYLVRFTYGFDKPYNCFPSIHVLVTFVVCAAILRSRVYSKSWKVFSIIISVLIIVSTVLIRQHVVLDIFGGIIYGIAAIKISDWIFDRIPNNYRS
jgi:membrane-associated phospholipid phosphatase